MSALRFGDRNRELRIIGQPHPRAPAAMLTHGANGMAMAEKRVVVGLG